MDGGMMYMGKKKAEVDAEGSDKDDGEGESTGKKMANNTTAAKLIVNEEDANLS